MKILVLNSGSSSVKYRLYEMEGEICLAVGSITRIGDRSSVLNHQRHDGQSVKMAQEIPDHESAIEYILDILLSPDHGVISDYSEIAAVGHRVVHGGEKFTASVLIDDEVMKQIHECIELAPLHNPHNIKGITAGRAHLPDAPAVAVFDTSFHHSMPDHAYIYGLPYVMYTRYGVRRYGFHGTSHRYVSARAADMLEKPLTDLKIITCHLGNGCSAAAVANGVSIDTSMGFTPTEGLLMGTRCGDLDPAALTYIKVHEDIGFAEINTLINKHSGLLGVSGVSNDMREIEEQVAAGNSRAELALGVYCYRIKKYIGAYAAAMGGVDGVVFTGGVGENSVEVRRRVCEGLEFIGLKVSTELNRSGEGERFIDATDPHRLMVIPTNEELVIARDTLELISRQE